MATMARKNERLDALVREVAECTDCSLCKNRIKSVFSKGCSTARIMLIGEAPGKQENEQGIPFVGRSGEQLNNMLKEAGFKNPEKEIYFCNVVKCRPVKNVKDRKPKKLEIQACIKYLNAQIEIVKPEIIILCGNTAKNIFKIYKAMSIVHGTSFDYNGLTLVPVYHPRASIATNVKLSDLKKIKKL